MAFLKKATTIAVLASAGVMGMSGMASANEHPQGGDNAVGQGGLIPINALNNVNVAPNLGCLLDRTIPDLTVQSLIGLIPIGVNLSHLLEHLNLNVLSNGNITTETYDNSCTSNQGSSQAGNNSHGSVGAGNSASEHSSGENSGSHNPAAGAGAGGLLGSSGILGRGGLGL
jgi:hypothetical protein